MHKQRVDRLLTDSPAFTQPRQAFRSIPTATYAQPFDFKKLIGKLSAAFDRGGRAENVSITRVT